MNNLQELYDHYLDSKPSAGKIKAATTTMIHVCKAMEIATQEEITSEHFEDIPQALDEYFLNYPLKSTQDKAMLAEMIGRVGPKPELQGLFEKLLNDHDENVRQYSFHSLEYFGKNNPHDLLPYIDRFCRSEDDTMKTMAAHLASNISCTQHFRLILQKIEEWHRTGAQEFVKEVLEKMIHSRREGDCPDENISEEELIRWTMQKFGEGVYQF